MKINVSKLGGVVFDGVDTTDYPDFCDAFLSSATIEDDGKDRLLTEKELDWVNENSRDWIYESVIELMRW